MVGVRNGKKRCDMGEAIGEGKGRESRGMGMGRDGDGDRDMSRDMSRDEMDEISMKKWVGGDGGTLGREEHAKSM